MFRPRRFHKGVTALISYVRRNLEENTEEMTEAIARVKTGQITYAVRDTRIEDNEIHEEDIMGIGDKGILAVRRQRKSCRGYRSDHDDR